MEIRADCNRKGGSYSAAGKTLSIRITHATMAASGPESLETQFARDLSAGVVCFFRNGDLYIDLKYDTGTMKFTSK